MKGIQFHDDFLTQFLRKNKYDTTRSLKNLQNYVLLRRKYSSKFERVTDEDLSAILPDKFYVLLPKRCPEGCAVIIVKIGNWNPTEFSFENLEKSILFLVMQILRDPMTQICGIKVIYDCKGSSFQQLRYVTPYNTYMYYHAMLVHFHSCVEDLLDFSLDPYYLFLNRWRTKKIGKRKTLINPKTKSNPRGTIEGQSNLY
ncbi:alpha-tocopherol transfer protein-like [Trichonephila inaurata madagascariensis]|uniref:Alpha-tocopherol transfer protein-like n=1 Tax=Trichonephila inaurata madagascariensis TaxID=2747483 RepID=A0A8X6YW92_9ARAC|nr:alpha-tocopherol transfer protein-like [Trichonephila inaurata madagascariensis]